MFIHVVTVFIDLSVKIKCVVHLEGNVVRPAKAAFGTFGSYFIITISMPNKCNRLHVFDLVVFRHRVSPMIRFCNMVLIRCSGNRHTLKLQGECIQRAR